MRKLICPVLLAMGMLLAVLGAQAQSPDFLRVQVPFQFVAGGKVLPAGQYDLRRVQDRDPSLLRISNVKGDGAVLFVAHDHSLASSDTQFVFVPDGEQYVLKSIRARGEEFSFQNSPRTTHTEVAGEYVIRGSN